MSLPRDACHIATLCFLLSAKVTFCAVKVTSGYQIVMVSFRHFVKMVAIEGIRY
jgi:hypothetical protein